MGYYTAVKKKANATGIKSCEDIPLIEDPADAGEMITLGYKTPETVAGFEIRRKPAFSERTVNVGAERMSGKQVPSITHAFYKQYIQGFGHAVFMLNFVPGKVHCIKSSYKSVHSPGHFFQCSSGGHSATGNQCIMNSDSDNEILTDYSRPLKVTAIIFKRKGRTNRSCEAAESVLLNLPLEHRGLGDDVGFIHSQTFQNVMATVASSLKDDIYIAYFDSAEERLTSCSKIALGENSLSSLWQSHREIASSHIGLDTQYTTCVAKMPAPWKHGNDIWLTSVPHM